MQTHGIQRTPVSSLYQTMPHRLTVAMQSFEMFHSHDIKTLPKLITCTQQVAKKDGGISRRSFLNIIDGSKHPYLPSIMIVISLRIAAILSITVLAPSTLFQLFDIADLGNHTAPAIITETSNRSVRSEESAPP
ncbi:hypothetical protein F5Y16DRAFT_394939 [Xylariaceae sp. FL0255]|nr:hypothetical protein F5Y16DRAFT_394939 [Xylariaceae sp. FL0255]